MDPQRERIVADLRGVVAGEVRGDDAFLHLYSTDASLYEIRPLAVVRPRTAADVASCVRYASEHDLAIHPRGAGTGLAGESLGPGIVVDFSHSMRRVLSLDSETVTVQPGVIHGHLNRQLAAMGRHFGPDPSTSEITTMGSVVALDGAGSHWLKYGSARDHVLSMEVVLADGTIAQFSEFDLKDAPASNGDSEAMPFRIAELIRREENLIEQYRPKSLVNRFGYQLHDVLSENKLQLAKLIVGSEGTLALITRVTLRTQPLPKARSLALVFFDRLESAALASIDASELGLAACDIMDRRLLALVRDADARFARIAPSEAEAVLVFEAFGDTESEAREKVQQAVLQCQFRKRLAFESRMASDTLDIELFRDLASRVTPRLHRVRGAQRPVPFVEDVAVPPQNLAPFLAELRTLLKTRQVTATLFGHSGHGQLHIRPFLDMNSLEDVRKLQDISTELFDLVVSFGGTVCGEHGAGLSRTWFVKRQFGPLYDVFREVKRIFDSKNTLNPGKVVADVAQPPTKNLRALGLPALRQSPGTDSSADGTQATSRENESPDEVLTTPLVQLRLAWTPAEAAGMAQACNGCGRCRTLETPTRMCPIYRSLQEEEASPRAKANLVRGIAAGTLPLSEITKDSAKALFDLCVHCHQCRLECPSEVDIPRLMMECKAEYVAAHGLRFSDWFLGRVDRWASWAASFRTIANWAIANRSMRWLMEKTFGIAQGRKLPKFATTSFQQWAIRKRLHRPKRGAGRKIAYFFDTYANWFDPVLGESLVAVMQHNGVSVYVPPRQKNSAMTRLAQGDVERARPLISRNVAVLAEAVRAGYQIVTTEPSAALCLSHEYPQIISDEDVQLVANNTVDACQYLWAMHERGELKLDFKPMRYVIAYHTPCHVLAMSRDNPGAHLLGLIPGVTVEKIERGCSGMAGHFGLKATNYRASLRAGFGLISAVRDPKFHVGATECSACKIQMEQGANKATIHPIKALASAYGIVPVLMSIFAARNDELTVT